MQAATNLDLHFLLRWRLTIGGPSKPHLGHTILESPGLHSSTEMIREARTLQHSPFTDTLLKFVLDNV
jgi:hypothetical protein